MAEKPISVYMVAAGQFHDIDFARLELLKLLAEDERIRTTVAANYSDLPFFLYVSEVGIVGRELQDQLGLDHEARQVGRRLDHDGPHGDLGQRAVVLAVVVQRAAHFRRHGDHHVGLERLGERGQLHELGRRVLLNAQHERHRAALVGSSENLHPAFDLVGRQPRVVAGVLRPNQSVHAGVVEPFHLKGSKKSVTASEKFIVN